MIAIDFFSEMHIYPIRVYVPPISGSVHDCKRFRVRDLIVAGL